MAEVAARLRPLMPIIRQPKIPIVSNLTGELVEPGEFSEELLLKAITSPDQWVKELDTLKQQGVESFREAGPGSTLIALNRLNGFSRVQTRNVLNDV